MAVGEKQIDVAVVVVVEELQPPAAQQPGRLRDAVGVRDVGERFAAVVPVEREHLLIDVGDEEILVAVAVEVRGVDAHARSRLPLALKATSAGSPISSHLPLPRLTNRKFWTVSLATNRSISPSLLMSVATTPSALPSARWMSVPALTSVNVPSPLLWKSRLGVGLKKRGMQ